MHFELYKDCCPTTKEHWRWRLLSSDGAVVALSTAGYATEDGCRQAVIDLKKISVNTPIETRRSQRPPLQLVRSRRF
jgi:uncharacterized protein YegP (UPF0339 family)